MKDNNFHFGAFVKSEIKKKEIRQEDFAKELGVSRAYLITMFDKSEWKSEYVNKVKTILKVQPETISTEKPINTTQSMITYLFEEQKKTIEQKNEIIHQQKVFIDQIIHAGKRNIDSA